MKLPDFCMIAKLKPSLRKGSKTDPSNYRRISLLSLISFQEIIEKVVQEHTRTFLTKNKLLYSY